MEFKKMKAREIILIALAGFLILMAVLLKPKPKSMDLPDVPVQTPILPVSEIKPYQHPVMRIGSTPVVGQVDEDEAAQREMKDQMDRDRNQQRRIKMLKMQLEQVNLQLDNEKAMTEINKLKKENAGYVKDSNTQTGADFPNIRVIYIGGAQIDKEAILSIDGTSYAVREKDKPMANVEILKVTDKSIKVHFDSPREMTTDINYIQD